MTDQTTFDRVRAIASDLYDLPEDLIKQDSNLRDDLLVDSLDQVELVMAVEEEFGAEILDADLEQIKTIGDVVAILDKVTA